MLKPTNYQLECVEALMGFLRLSRELGGPAAAFAQGTSERFGVGLSYFSAPGFEAEEFKGMPYVCLRLPTGGGKTLLACLSVPVVQRELLQSDRSVVLWLVPSRAIQAQTLAALRDRTHHYRQALETQLGAVEAIDPTEALYLTKGTLDSSTVIIVSTLQSFRITEKEGRKVYDSSGALHHHFAGLEPVAQAVLERNESGVMPYSLANVLRLRRPIVIVDEAHNARTALSFDTLARFRPSCILEFTATPAKEKAPSNVLYHVSAKQLAAEDMIKLPIRLETRSDWLRLLADAVALREDLERKARAEEKMTGEHLRPIVLLKAERRDKDRETRTVEVVEKALIEECKVPVDWIVRATGDERGLDDVNLFDPKCPVRFIITVDALKEGWDCSWAYVLCSVAEMKSDTAVEQIIGRVLRLPGAKRRQTPELNRAYAFATSHNFAETARALEDALVDGNGFNPLEAKDLIVTTAGEQGKLEISASRAVPPHVVPMGEVPDTQRWSRELGAKLSVDANAGSVTFVEPLTESEITQAAASIVMETNREQFVAAARAHARAVEQIFVSPAERGVKLSVPVFCVDRQGVLELLDEAHFLERAWSLRDYLGDVDADSGEFAVIEAKGGYGEVGLSEQGKVRWTFGDELADELRLIEVTENWSDARLIDWIDRNIPHPDISADESGVFITAVIDAILAKGKTLGQLVRARFNVRAHVEERIAACRAQAKARAFQEVLFAEESGKISVSAEQVFTFDPDRYPARFVCPRSEDFQRHYHRQVGELGEKGEEFECALFLDAQPEIETWVRNLERQPEKSFWLPTATDRFYPDFICKLKDARILVVEYKGEDRWSNDDSKEKRRLGELWAERSAGRCVFVMPNGKDFGAIARAIAGKA